MPTDAAVIRSDVPGSFARAVFHERHPELIRRVLAALPYGPGERAALERLLAESTGGVLEPLDEDAHDHAAWLAWGQNLWGRPWGEAPFLWAESYFYRRLLEATGYFRPGAWQGIDPFGPFKAAELATAPAGGGDGPPEALLAASLWGNRADLGFRITAGGAGRAAEGPTPTRCWSTTGPRSGRSWSGRRAAWSASSRTTPGGSCCRTSP